MHSHQVGTEYAKNILQMGINTVDSYDIHGQLAGLRRELDAVAKASGTVAIVSAGWDPGTDSYGALYV